ncbi:MAG: BrnT family toxin [Chitinophagales bacterium]|nr:BrnT family toxin [Chitinophagales bacterium]
MERIKFEWDDGNKHKSVNKHGVSNAEAESVFYDEELYMKEDKKT